MQCAKKSQRLLWPSELKASDAFLEIRSKMNFLQPPDWPRPKGYANGVATRGSIVFLSGPTGFDRVRGKVVLVLIVRHSLTPMAIPDALRNKISAFVVSG